MRHTQKSSTLQVFYQSRRNKIIFKIGYQRNLNISNRQKDTQLHQPYNLTDTYIINTEIWFHRIPGLVWIKKYSLLVDAQSVLPSIVLSLENVIKNIENQNLEIQIFLITNAHKCACMQTHTHMYKKLVIPFVVNHGFNAMISKTTTIVAVTWRINCMEKKSVSDGKVVHQYCTNKYILQHTWGIISFAC